MVHHAQEALSGSDVVCLLVDVSQPFGSGDAYALDWACKATAPKLLVLNKIDRVRKSHLLPRMARYGEVGAFEEIVPVSALTGEGCDVLLDLLWRRLPVGEPLFDPDLLTTHPERFLAAERVREKVLEVTRDELPFSTAVVIERWDEEGETGLVRISAVLLVERPGQKGILVGQGGEMIRRIGTAARLDLEEFLERRVHLELFVRHQARWREDRRLISRLDDESQLLVSD